MSRKNTIILILSLVVLLVAVGYFLIYSNQPTEENNLPLDLSNVSDDQIISLLRTNEDALWYLDKYKDFRIEKKIILTPESIVAGQEGENFKEVYQDLDLEANRYLRADLMNAAGSWGLISVLDFKTNSVAKAFGLMMLSAGIEAQ